VREGNAGNFLNSLSPPWERGMQGIS